MGLQILTNNSKTIISIDFDRELTCSQLCSYCYVINLEKIYPAYLEKVKRNTKAVKDNPTTFAQLLNSEYRQLRQSKSKKYSRLTRIPVRIYGDGDYLPEHYEFLKLLEFKFYIISKTLAKPTMLDELNKVSTISNLTNIVLSMDDANLLGTYGHARKYFKSDKYSLAYTGLADRFNSLKEQGFLFDIFFNISNKNVEKEKSKKIKEQCPCDSGLLAHNESCTYCNKCWRSTLTSGKDWNT